MKKIVSCLLCVVFFLVTNSVGLVYALHDEYITFHFNNKVFTYSLLDNLKTNSQFDLNHEINKYNRFGTNDERIKLLKQMEKLGFDKEISLNYIFPSLSQTINTIQKNIHIKSKDATLSINHNTEQVFLIKPEVIGIDLDRQALINKIFNSYINKEELSLHVPIKKTIPKQTKTDLEIFTNLRSDFSTNISSSTQDRKHNVKNALTSLNKIEIAPNEIFSFNKIVGRRTAENGYRAAKIIVNNEFVDGIGGGVCQVSSTLYNAALLAGLEIIEANKHSKQVGYVKAGFDAMVNFGSSDLKFRNNTSEKLTIITNFSSTKARIRIFGAKTNIKYKLTNEIFNIVEPNEEILVDEQREHLEKVEFEDEFFFLKKPSKGMEIKSFREKYIDGKLVETELIRHDRYKVQNGVKIYGSQKRTHQTQEKSTEVICA